MSSKLTLTQINSNNQQDETLDFIVPQQLQKIYDDLSQKEEPVTIQKVLEKIKTNGNYYIQVTLRDNCDLLICKLSRMLNKNKRYINEAQFKQLFDFDFINTDQADDNFDLLFDFITKLDNKQNDKMTIKELKYVSNKYELALTDHDMEMMIKYASDKDRVVVQKQALKKLINEPE